MWKQQQPTSHSLLEFADFEGALFGLEFLVVGPWVGVKNPWKEGKCLQISINEGYGTCCVTREGLDLRPEDFLFKSCDELSVC